MQKHFTVLFLPYGFVTENVYNQFGDVVKRIQIEDDHRSNKRQIVTLLNYDKLEQSRKFFYDASGNIVSKVDRNGRITEWTFDRLNRHTSETWYDNYESWSKKNASKKFVTTYNRAGKLSTVEDGENKFNFTYGIFGNEIKQVQTLTGLDKPVEFDYTTDIANLRTETSLKVNDTEYVNKYEFDAIGKAKSISQNDKSVTIDYNNFGERKTLNRFVNEKEVVKTDYNWDKLGRITEIKHGDVNSLAYTWDNANRITKIDSASDKAKYEYDKTSQLINASYTKLPEEKYSYDKNGNRKANKTGEYNRLLSDNENKYEYDVEGNRISKTSSNGTTKYSWDNRNRLVKVETPTETVEYVYDYQNRLVRRNDEVFIHDGWQIVLQLKNNKPTHQYLWGINQDELLCDNGNWTLGDHLNSVRDVVSATGSVEHFEYDAFGKLLSDNSANIGFAYTGKMRDSVSNLQWNINRWYDANVGRWCSEDPIGFEGRDNNLFRYVRSNSIRYNDLFGLIPQCSSNSDIGNRWGSTTVVYSNGERDLNTTFAVTGKNPGDFEGIFMFAMLATAMVTAAGVADPELTVADIITSDEHIPTGASVVKLLAELREAIKNVLTFEVWIEYHCIECKCRTTVQWLAGNHENPNWQITEKKWAKCDLSNTSIQESFAGGLSLSEVKLNDITDIDSQCRNQLFAQLEGLCQK